MREVHQNSQVTKNTNLNDEVKVDLRIFITKMKVGKSQPCYIKNKKSFITDMSLMPDTSMALVWYAFSEKC